MRRATVALGGLLLGLAVAPRAAADPHGPAGPPVEARLLTARGAVSPFPSDLLTAADPAQRTGLRVDLPLPDCAAQPSACDDVRLLNELDGFDLSPRLALGFSGPIDLASVSARSVFLVRLAAGPAEATGVERLVWDPATQTLYARPDTLLEPETRYGLVVTRALLDARGRPVQPPAALRRVLAGTGSDVPRAYRQALAGLLAALARRGINTDQLVAASVFTTGSVSAFLEQVREGLDRGPSRSARMAATTEGRQAWFRRDALAGLLRGRHVRVVGPPPDPSTRSAVPPPPEPPPPPDLPLQPPPGLELSSLPLAALAADAVGGLGIGWYWSPWYLSAERRIVEGPTGRPPAPAAVEVAVPLVVVLPAGPPPAGGWAAAIFGHGYGGDPLTGALLIATTLARHGLATVAVPVVGHGGGPDGRLVVRLATGVVRTVHLPGRGVDLDGDGRFDLAEGLAPSRVGALATLGLRDGLRQQAVDLLALVRALAGGLDVDGDGRPDLDGTRLHYVGQSLGGIYGTLFLAVEPRLRVGVLNVAGGPVPEIARLSAAFRPLLTETLASRVPSLQNRARGFRADLPLRGQPPVAAPAPGALAIQEYLARAEWLGRRGDPVAYARHLGDAPLPGVEPARVLVQLAAGDGVVPNPTSATLVRAGALADRTTLLRYDRVQPSPGPEWREPHGFLLNVLAPGAAGALARAAQEQVARFFRAEGAEVWDPDDAVPPPFRERVFEVPAAGFPDGPVAGDED
jgi:hypothetical protein